MEGSLSPIIYKAQSHDGPKTIELKKSGKNRWTVEGEENPEIAAGSLLGSETLQQDEESEIKSKKGKNYKSILAGTSGALRAASPALALGLASLGPNTQKLMAIAAGGYKLAKDTAEGFRQGREKYESEIEENDISRAKPSSTDSVNRAGAYAAQTNEDIGKQVVKQLEISNNLQREYLDFLYDQRGDDKSNVKREVDGDKKQKLNEILKGGEKGFLGKALDILEAIPGGKVLFQMIGKLGGLLGSLGGLLAGAVPMLTGLLSSLGGIATSVGGLATSGLSALGGLVGGGALAGAGTLAAAGATAYGGYKVGSWINKNVIGEDALANVMGVGEESNEKKNKDKLLATLRNNASHNKPGILKTLVRLRDDNVISNDEYLEIMDLAVRANKRDQRKKEGEQLPNLQNQQAESVGVSNQNGIIENPTIEQNREVLSNLRANKSSLEKNFNAKIGDALKRGDAKEATRLSQERDVAVAEFHDKNIAPLERQVYRQGSMVPPSPLPTTTSTRDGYSSAAQGSMIRPAPAPTPNSRVDGSNVIPTRPTATPIPVPGPAAGDGLGGLSAHYESGKRGSEAVGFDSTGGTSYGKYQIATRTGTMNKFMNFLKTSNPAAYQRLAAAGPADAGKGGRFAQEWQALAKEGALGTSEHDFIKKTHYDVGMQGIKGEGLQKMLGGNKALQDVMWSTSVQHGGGGASNIFNKVYKEGMSEGDLIKAVYSERGTRFGSSSANVQQSVRNRFVGEQQNALAMLGSTGNMSPSVNQNMAPMPSVESSVIPSVQMVSAQPSIPTMAPALANNSVQNAGLQTAMNTRPSSPSTTAIIGGGGGGGGGAVGAPPKGNIKPRPEEPYFYELQKKALLSSVA